MTAITVVAPRACTVDELTAFKRMVIAGGEVSPDPLPTLVEQALALAFARRDGALIGVAGIKRPWPEYRALVFAKAQSLRDPGAFEFELGWCYVSPGARGQRLASALLALLMPALDGRAAYASSRANNHRMHASLRGVGFQPEGSPYPSRLGNHDMQLFLSGSGA